MQRFLSGNLQCARGLYFSSLGLTYLEVCLPRSDEVALSTPRLSEISLQDRRAFISSCSTTVRPGLAERGALEQARAGPDSGQTKSKTKNGIQHKLLSVSMAAIPFYFSFPLSLGAPTLSHPEASLST